MSDPACNVCGDTENHLGTLNEEPLCHKCWNKKTRDMGLRDHESTSWHNKLDKVLKGDEDYVTHGTDTSSR